MGKLFVSRKKYDEVREIALKGQDEITNLQLELQCTKNELDKQIAVNQSLEKFSEKFKEFYQKVTHLPVLVRQERGVKSVASSIRLVDREISYGHVVESMKQQLTHELAENLLRSGDVRFDLVDDPITGGTVYKATISVVEGGRAQ